MLASITLGGIIIQTEFRTTLQESVMFDKLVDEQLLKLDIDSDYMAYVTATFSDEGIDRTDWPTSVLAE